MQTSLTRPPLSELARRALDLIPNRPAFDPHESRLIAAIDDAAALGWLTEKESF